MLFIATLASVLLFALSLPNEIAPYGTAWIGFFCLAPYFFALTRTKSYAASALLGFVFGVFSHAATSYWLYFFEDYAVWTIGATSVAYGFLHILVAGFIRRAGLERNTALRPFLIALVWTVWEWQKSIGFLGYPWGLIAYAVNDRPLMIQIADSLGVYGLSFMLALSSALLAGGTSAFRRAGWSVRWTRTAFVRGSVVFLAIFIWFNAYGGYRLSNPTPVIDRVPMLLIQHNADSWELGELDTLRTLIRLSRRGWTKFPLEKPSAPENTPGFDRPALIVWSETVLRRPFEDYLPFFRKNPAQDPLIPFLAQLGVPLLTGAPIVLDWDTYDASNAAILINPDASVPFTYAKRQLVPFAEGIPFWEYAWMRSFMKNVVGLDGGWTAGTEATVMETPTPSGRPLRFGVPICFEDAFASVCAGFFRRGADILINITNDSWSRTVSAETQHLAAARFRTVENRRVLVRATNGGVTAVIDAEGRVIASAPLFSEEYLAAVVPIQAAQIPTAYALLGDWFPALLALLGLLYLLRGVRSLTRLDKRHGLRQPYLNIG